ncbi:Glucooligosaccharide oxidase [Mycena venus]|uniref:Glucooligosaccharide oxidase n=1 Tax=Mycena venus TaxID=2733690 RepID=A0A8H6XW92_9AGAR|nr:Glucooligosaccharide oxidase [Mycena venus]
MIPRLLLNIAATLLCATAQNIAVLKQTLSANGVPAVYPTDKNFKNVSKAFNERFTFVPIAVVFPTSVAQVSTAVAAGAAQNLEVVARSGGHSYIANGLGGRNGALVVDMSKLKAITVRPSNNTALIETGNRLGDVALALNAKGRAIPHGTCSYVGIGGHSGYGGFGFTSRAWGLTLDTVKSATVVLGNGTIVSASPNVNPDLFFAIRGASPSFGIVTSIEVQTFPAPPSAIVFEYTWNNVDITTASNGIASFQTFAATDIPPEFGAELVFTKGDKKGKVNFGLTGAYYGDAKLFNSTLAPYLKTLPKNPSNTTITPGSYINSVGVLAAPKSLNTSSAPDSPDTFYTKSVMTPSGAPMSKAAITAFVTYMANQSFSSDTAWFVEVELYGGTNSAINAVPLDSAAFAKRDTLFTIQFYASSSDHVPPYPKDGFSFLDGMVASILDNSPSNWNYGAYLNYIDDRLVNAANLYYGSHFKRLESLKVALDPKNTFRFPIGVA